MLEPTGTPAEALLAVGTWLGMPDPATSMTQRWAVRPFQDAWWVAPTPRNRGDSAYLVRRGTVRPVLSDGQTTTAEAYAELVASQR